MLGTVIVKDYTGLFGKRGESKKLLTRLLKQAWALAGEYFHANLRERRFTIAHAKKAGYALRKGELASRNSKEWRYSYTRKKFRKFGHTRPLEFTGRTRRDMKAFYNVTSSSRGASVRYPGARAFNFRNPHSDPKMNLNLEFRKIIQGEDIELARVIDDHIGAGFHAGTSDAEVFDLLRQARVI